MDWVNLVNSCNLFNDKGHYLNKTNDEWGVVDSKPKNLTAVKTLRTILNDIQNTFEDGEDNASILQAAKTIKCRYDLHYAKSGRKIWESVKLFFTGKREKDEVHNLYREIKTTLKVYKEEEFPGVEAAIASEVNNYKSASIFDYFSLPSDEKKTLRDLIRKNSLRTNAEIDLNALPDSIKNIVVHETLKWSPKSTFEQLDTSYRELNEALNKVNSPNIDQYQENLKKIVELQSFNKILYTAYKEIYKDSKGPRPLEGLKLAFFGKTQFDEVKEEYKNYQQKLSTLKTDWENKKPIIAKAAKFVDKLVSDEAVDAFDSVIDGVVDGAEKFAKGIVGFFKRKKK